MFIEVTDFTERPYRIPNQNESTDLLSFLSTEEARLAIENLLGYDLWKDFVEAYDASLESGADPLDQKWSKIIEGAEYTYGSYLMKYNGWVDLLRPALYSLWIPKGSQKLTNIGYVENAPPQQSTLIDSFPSEVESWNQFVKKSGIYEHCHTFYGFMYENRADYPNWIYNPPRMKNRFDF